MKALLGVTGARGGYSAGGCHCLGALLTPERSLEGRQRLLEGLGIPGGGGLTVVYDGDQAIAGAVSLVLP